MTPTEQLRLILSGVVLALVVGATGVAIVLGTPSGFPFLALMALVLVTASGALLPVGKIAPILALVAAVGQTVWVIVGGVSVVGLASGVGFLAVSLAAGRFGWACCMTQKVQVEAERVLEALQPIDNVGGVLGWLHASLVFDREIARARRYKQSLALVRITVDRWDEVETKLGPDRAAEVVAEIGQHLVRSSRMVDVVAYHGDAVFDLLLPDTPGVGAMVVARRVAEFESSHPYVRLLVGIAQLDGTERSAEDLRSQGNAAEIIPESRAAVGRAGRRLL